MSGPVNSPVKVKDDEIYTTHLLVPIDSLLQVFGKNGHGLREIKRNGIAIKIQKFTDIPGGRNNDREIRITGIKRNVFRAQTLIASRIQGSAINSIRDRIKCVVNGKQRNCVFGSNNEFIKNVYFTTGARIKASPELTLPGNIVEIYLDISATSFDMASKASVMVSERVQGECLTYSNSFSNDFAMTSDPNDIVISCGVYRQFKRILSGRPDVTLNILNEEHIVTGASSLCLRLNSSDVNTKNILLTEMRLYCDSYVSQDVVIKSAYSRRVVDRLTAFDSQLLRYIEEMSSVTIDIFPSYVTSKKSGHICLLFIGILQNITYAQSLLCHETQDNLSISDISQKGPYTHHAKIYRSLTYTPRNPPKPPPLQPTPQSYSIIANCYPTMTLDSPTTTSSPSPSSSASSVSGDYPMSTTNSSLSSLSSSSSSSSSSLVWNENSFPTVAPPHTAMLLPCPPTTAVYGYVTVPDCDYSRGYLEPQIHCGSDGYPMSPGYYHTNVLTSSTVGVAYPQYISNYHPTMDYNYMNNTNNEVTWNYIPNSIEYKPDYS